MSIEVKFELHNAAELNAAIARAKDVSKDLTIPLMGIARHWFKTNRAIFTLKGPGQYPDLSRKYKKAKASSVGFVYPILKRTGRLEESITNPSHSDAIAQVINRDTVILGTKVPYGIYHQLGGQKIPYRPFVFLGPDSKYAVGEMSRRVDKFIAILEDYIAQKLSQDFEVKR